MLYTNATNKVLFVHKCPLLHCTQTNRIKFNSVCNAKQMHENRYSGGGRVISTTNLLVFGVELIYSYISRQSVGRCYIKYIEIIQNHYLYC
jgi:hypothetical protein